MDLIADLLLGLALMAAVFGSAGLILGVAAMGMAAIGEALIASGWAGGLGVRARVGEWMAAGRGERPMACWRNFFGDRTPPRAHIEEIGVGRGV